MFKNLDPVELTVFSLFALVVFALIVIIGALGYAGASCLEAGYPNAKIGGTTAYCIKRVDQTDVVVPLSVVKAGRDEHKP